MSANDRERDFASTAALRAQNAAELPERVRRLHRLGYPDRRIATELHVGHRKVVQVREALGLPANPGGAT